MLSFIPSLGEIRTSSATFLAGGWCFTHTHTHTRTHARTHTHSHTHTYTRRYTHSAYTRHDYKSFRTPQTTSETIYAHHHSYAQVVVSRTTHTHLIFFTAASRCHSRAESGVSPCRLWNKNTRTARHQHGLGSIVFRSVRVSTIPIHNC